jgi:hypothetical protein
MRFEGTSNYVATDDLKVAVNAAQCCCVGPCWSRVNRAPARPCWRRKSPRPSMPPLIEWNVKSTTKAHQGLYEYDAVARLRDGQLGDERVHDIRTTSKRASCGKPSPAPQLPVLLIDEIDKADIEFPNDLLQELDRMSFDVYETQERFGGRTPDRGHHLEQRKGTARRVPAPLLLPLHQVPRSRHDAGDHRRPLPRHPENPGQQGDGYLLRSPRCPGPQEEALDQRTARLAEAAPERRHAARRPAARDPPRRSRRSTARCSRTSRT